MSNSYNSYPRFNESTWSKLPNYFDLTRPMSILRWAESTVSLKLSFHDTFFILDLSNENCLENAAVFDLKRGILKTTQTTRELLRQLVRQADYWHRHYLEQVAIMNNITLIKLPFVKGDVCLIPLSSATQKSASWFSATQLSHQETAGSKRTELTYLGRLRLIIPVSLKRIRRQLLDSQRLQAALVEYLVNQRKFVYGELSPVILERVSQKCQRLVMCDFLERSCGDYDLIVTRREIEQTTDNYFGKF